MADYGYVRVSTRDQNEERQMIAMREVGIPEKNIYLDKQSGKDFDRPKYIKLVRKLRDGDTLYIKSIDRLGRNYDGILEEWKALTKKGVGIVVMDMPILNTSKDRDLTGRLIADIVLQLLSYVAQTEREFSKQRQREGIDAAMARGVKFGRPPVPRPDNLEEIAQKWQAGLISAREGAAELRIDHHTFQRWAREIGYHAANPRPGNMSAAHIEAIDWMFGDGYTAEDIAQRLNVRVSRVEAVIRARGGVSNGTE